jgi:hypothetical protein
LGSPGDSCIRMTETPPHYTDADGKVLPTKKGLSLPIGLLPDLVKAMKALAGAADGFEVKSTTQGGDVEF